MNDGRFGYDASTYGERIAEVYDAWHPASDSTAIDTLAELSRGGRVLELAIGTGRLALPLAARGLEVHGIDASPAMVAKLRAKPGGTIPVVLGDFANVEVEGTFSLVFVAFNTIYALLTQAEQVRCFRNVARHLTDDGCFVLEAFVPDLGRFRRGQTVTAGDITSDAVRIDVSHHDPVAQVVTSQHVVITETGTRLYPVRLRYAWPPELDLMAQLAGLALRDRWGGWDRRPFTAESDKHVSVYGR